MPRILATRPDRPNWTISHCPNILAQGQKYYNTNTHTHKNIICKIILLSSEYSDCIEDEMFSLRKKIFLKQKMFKHRNSVTQNTFSILSKLNNPNKLLSECAFYFQEQKFIWLYMTQNIVLQTIKYSVVVLVVSKS